MSDLLPQMQEALKKSLVKIKRLEAELEATQSASSSKISEPIAIIGLGCRFPGGIHDLDTLWKALLDRKDMSRPIPKDRWDNDAIYDSDPLHPGKTHAKTAAFLDNDVKAFDAPFFGIVPREAKSIDPLQRMILEVVYEAMEEANIPSEQFKGTNTAVYIAIGNSDYIQARFRSGNLETMDVYDATGIPFATAAGRVSYLYDLQGPNLAIDAACASSIVGMHLACVALNQKETDMAIVASANLLLTPELFVGLSKLGSLSASGECRAFSNDADGYVRGEGCGVVILQRKSDAEKENNSIHALILGSAVKHDGLSNGFTAPNPKVQVETIQQAIQNSGIHVDDISFVEAHGIGNKFTDAMEIQSIANGYKGISHEFFVGSLKPNLGHLEAAIGMAMLFKVIGTLQHKEIAPNIHFNTPNEDIPWNKIQVKIPTDSISIHTDKPVYAAINLSGYSGTNVHMIFSSYENRKVAVQEVEGNQLFVWSAKNRDALKALIQKYLESWDEISQHSLTSLAYTLQMGRTHWDEKLSVVAGDMEDVHRGLLAYFNDTKDYPYTLSSYTDGSKDVAFLFTGQGAQYHGMCRDLYDSEKVFRDAVDACAQFLDKALPIPIRDVLWFTEDSNLIHQTFYTQPSLFVVEYALAKLWMSKGIQPAALLGHSIGEFVALTISGCMTLHEALKLVAIRGHLMQSLPKDAGAMALVLSDETTVRHYTEQTHGRVDIAAVNTPNSVAISGDKNAVHQLTEALKEVKIKSLAIPVSHAFHSYMMDSILEKFEKEVAKIQFKAPQIPVISNVSGLELSLEDLTPAYFSKHLRSTVRFVEDVEYLHRELGIQIFLECGPAPTLSSFVSKILSQEDVVCVSSAKKDKSSKEIFLQSVQKLFHVGMKIQWEEFYSNQKIPKLSLPTYAWQKQVYWENPVRGIQKSEHTDGSVETIYDMERQMVKSEAKEVKVSKENVMAIMQLEAAETLGLLPGQKIDPNKSLREQGFDSMMSGEFLSRMEHHFHSQLEMSLIHTYGTLNELQRYFVDEFLGGGEIDESQSAVTMSDIVFGSDQIGSRQVENWHKIQENDPGWLKVFKKIDKMISTPQQ